MAGTGSLDINSQLIRNKWTREGLVQKASKSFFNRLTGNTDESIVYQKNTSNAEDGHTIIFDYSGNLSGRAIKGKDTAFGTGEVKKLFSSRVTVERWRHTVDNGDTFDGVEIGNLAITQHSDSRSKLSDVFIRFKDQGMFDSAQGLLTGQPASHTIDLGSTLTLNSLTDIENSIKISQYTTGGVRIPLKPYQHAGEDPVWLFVCDSTMLTKLKQDSNFQVAMSRADTRGDSNRVIKGKLGKIGHLLIVEADHFFGLTDGTDYGWDLNSSDIEISGLRQYKGADPTTAIWSGQEGFDVSGDALHSRGLLLGSGALQFAMGKEPDYKIQLSSDFGIKSESALETWLKIQKTVMTTEVSDYNEAKVAGIDWGVVVVDVEI
jgi:hypothetical protein